MPFEITKALLETVTSYIKVSDSTALVKYFEEMHHADIAEILDELSFDEAVYIIKLLDSEKTSEVLMDVDDDVREKILQNLSAKEIAEEVKELDSDDAADIIGELSEERQEAVMSQIEDEEHVKEIEELLNYEEDTAGSLMAKELVRVNENWTVLKCVREMRIQAEEVNRIHSIYVVDNEGKLKGRLSLKDLLITSTRTAISQVYIPNVDYVHDNDNVDEVSLKMRKYDLEAIPVVDENHILLGRITIDDIVDVIKEEAEKDYQLAAGIVEDVEADDSIFELTKARLPWLILGLFGGLGSVLIMDAFDDSIKVIKNYDKLFFFTPLIAAMAGNVGVQSSAIIVQGLANDTVKGSPWKRLLKEVGLSLINGSILGLILLSVAPLVSLDLYYSVTVAVSMLSVIIVASLVGTFVPIILDRKGIDPAIATGPFITTSNDIFGIFLFFFIAKSMLI